MKSGPRGNRRLGSGEQRWRLAPCSRLPGSCPWEASIHLEVQQERGRDKEEKGPSREKAGVLAEGPGIGGT